VSNETVSIIFAGDISMDKPIRKENGSSCPYSGLLSNLTRYFQSVDYNMVNVEAPFVTREMAKHPAFPSKGKLSFLLYIFMSFPMDKIAEKAVCRSVFFDKTNFRLSRGDGDASRKGSL